jgi:hypothetical protein
VKAKELIAQLSELDPDTDVVLPYFDWRVDGREVDIQAVTIFSGDKRLSAYIEPVLYAKDAAIDWHPTVPHDEHYATIFWNSRVNNFFIQNVGHHKIRTNVSCEFHEFLKSLPSE